ncbi:MAG: tRNA (adenosine(37)-N6)-threonylcarbamoyltransferase complex dimerization subunit type 1 TsaB [Desulfovibrionales bacterium]|nr:tRNA (adenosine(37)-N6)-threonylcarbamoyltransferase complex dimerization subunit type 1 TsaB [Desulfovibrionales bacterium]
MKLLSLSTAEQGGSVAVFNSGRLACESYWDSKITHSQRLTPMVEQVLDQSGIGMHQIDGFIAAKGPGSFTGLRIGIAFILGLAQTTGKPAAGVSSLDAIAWQWVSTGMPVCAMMDARRNEVYSSVYRFVEGTVIKTQETVSSPLDVISPLENERVLYVGSGARAYKTYILDQVGSNAEFPIAGSDHVSASTMGQIALGDENFFQTADNALLPVYIRKSDAEYNLLKRQGY